MISKIDPMQNHSMQDAVRQVAPSITHNSREHGKMFQSGLHRDAPAGVH